MRPTSCATSNGTGISSPTQEGMEPISLTCSTRSSSSMISTMRHDLPRVMKVANGSAKEMTKLSSRVPTILREPMSRMRYVRSSGIMDMLS
ncbi:MAG: hypothetical protein A4E30_00658 [Methanomassiliicoccales archaeon PtaB.Bin215]|nr:MAG: hypothetical protein A4E30_00658 [Methanomassiliicoccales archaeon PtaB.Bin215]